MELDEFRKWLKEVKREVMRDTTEYEYMTVPGFRWSNKKMEVITVLESQTTQAQLTSKEISTFLNRIAEFTESLKLPHTIFITDLRHDKYKLTQPIPVSIEYEDDTVIASFYDVDVYGTGDDIQEAITDLC